MYTSAGGSAVLLLSLLALGSAQVDLSTCGDEDSVVTCSFFFVKVDAAFRQENVLYTLRKAFFPAEGAPSLLFDVELALDVEMVPNLACDDPNYKFGDYLISAPPTLDEVCSEHECGPYSVEWRHQWSKTIISYIIEREDLELLQDTSFVAFSAASFNSFDTSVFSADPDELDEGSANNQSLGATQDTTVQFQLTIPFLPCRPDDGVLLDAWEDILPWLQLYSQNSDGLTLEEVEYSQEARGFAFREGRARRGGLTVSMLTVIHILINVVFALGATYFLHKYHHYLNQVQGKQYQLVASMYWSVVFTCFIGAVVIIVGNCYLYYALLFIDDRSLTVFGFRIASDITVAILAVIELVASMLTPHDPGFFIPHLIRRTLCCNQCCHCCGSQKRMDFMRRAILGIAMWIIIVFLQVVVASLLPLSVVIVLNPVPSIAFVSIMIALFFCLVVFVAYLVNAFEGNYISRHRLSTEERRKSSVTWNSLKRDWSVAGNWVRDKVILVAQAFVFLVIFVIVALAVILYLNFVRAGANTNTVSGLLLSLVPSVVLGGITWAAKKHLFKELEEEIEAEKEEQAENNEEEESTFFTLGGISLQRRSVRKKSTKRKKMLGEAGRTPSSANPLDFETNFTVENGSRPGSDAIITVENVAHTEDAEDREQRAEENEETDNEGVVEASGGEATGQMQEEKNGKLVHELPVKAVSIDVQELQVPFLRTGKTFDEDDAPMV